MREDGGLSSASSEGNRRTYDIMIMRFMRIIDFRNITDLHINGLLSGILVNNDVGAFCFSFFFLLANSKTDVSTYTTATRILDSNWNSDIIYATSFRVQLKSESGSLTTHDFNRLTGCDYVRRQISNVRTPKIDKVKRKFLLRSSIFTDDEFTFMLLLI